MRGKSGQVGNEGAKRLVHHWGLIFDSVLAQCRATLAVVYAVGSGETNQASLHLVKAAGADDVVVTRGQRIKLILGSSHAVIVHRMRGECARDESRLLLFKRIELLKEVDEGDGIVAGGVLIFDSEE